MILSEKKLENAKMQVEIEIPANNVDSEYEKVFKEIQKRAVVDGFRKGKAPLDLVIRKFKSQADEEVAESLAKAEYMAVLDEKKYSPITMPKFDFKPIEKNTPFRFTAIFEIMPTVELGKFKNIDVEEKVCEISDKDIENEIETLREKHASVSKKNPEDIIAKGDYVTIKVKRTDNAENTELKEAELMDVPVMVGKQDNEYSFDNHIIGMKKDEEKEVTLKYPKGYKYEALAGQKVKYYLKVAEVNKVDLPKLDDNFAKDVGDYSSLDEFKTKLKENMQTYVKDLSKKRTKIQIVSTIVDNSKFDIPESMIYDEMSRMVSRLQERWGIDDINKYLNNSSINKEEFWKKIREDAEKDVKVSLVLSEIAKKENLKVTEEKFKESLINLGKTYGKSQEEMEQLAQEQNVKDNIEFELMLGNAEDYIYDNANIKRKKPVPLSEFLDAKDKDLEA